MKRVLVSALSLGATGLAALLFIVACKTLLPPLSYMEAPLDSHKVQQVLALQISHSMTTRDVACTYLYLGGDYEKAVPSRMEVNVAKLAPEKVRVSIFDPSPEDDSMTASMDRVYLDLTPEGRWKPVKHEWAQQGRGRIGWTTKPTL